MNRFELRHNNGNGARVKAGDAIKDFRGDSSNVAEGVGRAPHKHSSEGHVWDTDGNEFYAGVYGLKWVPLHEH